MALYTKSLSSFLNNEDTKKSASTELLIYARDNRGHSALFYYLVLFCWSCHQNCPKLRESCSLQLFLSTHYLISDA